MLLQALWAIALCPCPRLCFAVTRSAWCTVQCANNARAMQGVWTFALALASACGVTVQRMRTDALCKYLVTLVLLASRHQPCSRRGTVTEKPCIKKSVLSWHAGAVHWQSHPQLQNAGDRELGNMLHACGAGTPAGQCGAGTPAGQGKPSSALELLRCCCPCCWAGSHELLQPWASRMTTDISHKQNGEVLSSQSDLTGVEGTSTVQSTRTEHKHRAHAS